MIQFGSSKDFIFHFRFSIRHENVSGTKVFKLRWSNQLHTSRSLVMIINIYRRLLREATRFANAFSDRARFSFSSSSRLRSFSSASLFFSSKILFRSSAFLRRSSFACLFLSANLALTSFMFLSRSSRATGSLAKSKIGLRCPFVCEFFCRVTRGEKLTDAQGFARREGISDFS